MYLTFLNKLIEFLLDIGPRGFLFSVYLHDVCLFSIDTSWFEIAIPVIAIVKIMKGFKK